METEVLDLGFECAPVLLVGFNRPDFISDQISAIRKAAPRKLYIAVDGPRQERVGEMEKCRAVQACAELVDWPCVIKTLFRQENLGCKYGVSSAVTWFFENEESGIILEDDCRPTLGFLRFASEMLCRYRTDSRIGAVNGFNCFNLQSDDSASYHFSEHMDVWGWASWRRVWREYDVELTKYRDKMPAIIDQSKMSRHTKKLYKHFLVDLANGLSTWDVQLSLLFLVKKWLSIVPKTRLVANAGIADARATHTGGYVYWNRDWSRTGELDFPLVHPAKVVCDEQSDRLREDMESAIFPRGLTWLGAKMPLLCPALAAVGSIAERLAPCLFRI